MTLPLAVGVNIKIGHVKNLFYFRSPLLPSDGATQRPKSFTDSFIHSWSVCTWHKFYFPSMATWTNSMTREIHWRHIERLLPRSMRLCGFRMMSLGLKGSQWRVPKRDDPMNNMNFGCDWRGFIGTSVCLKKRVSPVFLPNEELSAYCHCHLTPENDPNQFVFDGRVTSVSVPENWKLIFLRPNGCGSNEFKFCVSSSFLSASIERFPTAAKILTITWERIFQFSWIMDAEVTSSACQTHYFHRILIWLFQLPPLLQFLVMPR